MSGSVNIREATFADYPGIVLLMARYGMETKPEWEWRHLWEQNPAWRAQGGRWPIGWCLESGGQIVGFLGNIPLFYHFSGRRLLASVACEWVVEKPFRKANPRLTDAFFSQTLPDLFLNTTAINATGRIFLERGGQRAPVAEYDVALFWIRRHRRFVQSLFRLRGWRGGELVAPLAAVPLALRSAGDRLMGPRGLDASELRDHASFGGEFEEFWETNLARAKGKLLCDRSRETLLWHFRFAMEQGKVKILSCDLDGKVRSYAVFLRQDNPGIGLSRARLVD